MAIAKENIDRKVCVKTPQSTPEAYDTITKSDRATPLDVQVACESGSPWPVTYYRQRLGRDNEMRYSDTELSPSFQSYVRIKNLVLRVTRGIEPSVEEGINTSTGTAIVTGITPIVGDSFVGALVAGMYYVFNVTSVTPMTFLASTAYNIEYELICTADINSARIQDLTNKTFKTMVWDGTLGSCGQPLVSEEVALVRDELNDMLSVLMNEYLRLFLDADTDLFILEEDGIKLYDDHLTQFILHAWPLERTILGKRVRGISPNISEKIYHTLWDELIHRSKLIMKTTNVLGMIDSNQYNYNYSEINTMAHRVDWVVGHNVENIANTTPFSSVFSEAVTVIPEIAFNNAVSPLYAPITNDEYYVLTEAYYNGTGGPVLDRMTRAYVEGDGIDEATLMTLVMNWKEWPMTNKYWQTPLLVLLIRYVLEDKKGESISGASKTPCADIY